MVGGEIAKCFFHWVCLRVFDQSSVEDAAFWKRRRTRNIYQSWVDGRFHIVSRCRPLIFLTARTIFIFYGVVNISTCSFVNVCFDAHVGVIYDVSMLRNGPRYVTLWKFSSLAGTVEEDWGSWLFSSKPRGRWMMVELYGYAESIDKWKTKLIRANKPKHNCDCKLQFWLQFPKRKIFAPSHAMFTQLMFSS